LVCEKKGIPIGKKSKSVMPELSFLGGARVQQNTRIRGKRDPQCGDSARRKDVRKEKIR